MGKQCDGGIARATPSTRDRRREVRARSMIDDSRVARSHDRSIGRATPRPDRAAPRARRRRRETTTRARAEARDARAGELGTRDRPDGG